MVHLRRLAQFLLASVRGDGAGRRRPSPRTRQDDGAVDGWARNDSEPPPVRRSGGVPRGRRSSSLPALPRPRLRCCLRVRDPQRRLGGEEPCDDLDNACSPDHNYCVQESHMDWGYVPRFGFKGAIFEHLYINYRGSQVDMDRTMIKCILVL
ncbi:unnamed protein product [Triticum turgidum subsp. durum]|uniref:Uncharacterized protein n=1 Tax=Triticum turgidum subsp. durum TaxID=4567 RepID=A0A9R1BTL6_TRITD|nr:unnamed protein product [Triticum turgidum subsp. durum]